MIDKRGVEQKLLNKMAYGALTRGDLPGQLEDYNVSLIRQYHKKSAPVLKLKFSSKKSSSEPDFYIKIDQVRKPANSIILVKYQENDGIVKAKTTNKIKEKMIFSVEKEEKDRHEVLQAEEEGSDSDIPRGKPLYEIICRELDEKQ